MIGKTAVMDACAPGTLGGTYGGNPVSCAAALANIAYLESENLIERSAQMGEVIRSRFLQMQAKCDLIAKPSHRTYTIYFLF